MKATTIFINELKWDYLSRNGLHVYVKGGVWIEGIYFNGSDFAGEIISFYQELNDSSDELHKITENVLNKISGHFSFVVESESYLIAAVDCVRTSPLFYMQCNNSWLFSNSANYLYLTNTELKANDYALLQFRMSGYVSGNNTLLEDIRQLNAGEYIIHMKFDNRLEDRVYFKYGTLVKSDVVNDENVLFNELDNVLEVTFSKLIKVLDGRTVYIPLSGGLDSRLILALLKEYGYRNIFTYTYGIKGIWEIERAQIVANAFAVPWAFLEMEPSTIREYFHTNDRKNYFQFAGNLTSIPQIPEYYGLILAREHFCVPEDAVFINGQSGDFITGGHIPSKVTQKKILTRDDLVNSIIDKHYSLWKNLKTCNNIKLIQKSIEESFQDKIEDKMDKEVWSKLYEQFEWKERQSKYVVNGQRAYEWFGYGWQLPLWSNEMIEFWSQIPWELKYKQRLFKGYLRNRNFGGVFNEDLSLEYSYQPMPVFAFRKVMGLLNNIFSADLKNMTDEYTKYFMHYAPFYPQLRYREYLKDAKHHRNPCSFWGRTYLNEAFG